MDIMEKKLLIIQNIKREGPGLLSQVLERRKIPSTLIPPEEVAAIKDLSHFKAVVILGGPDSANDPRDRILREVALVKEVIDKNIPYLGICLGMQLLVKAAGGEVYRAKEKEVGFYHNKEAAYTVRVVDEALGDPIFRGLENPFRVFQLHGETVSLGENAALIAEGNFCREQIVKVGQRAYGIQCHFEMTKDMLRCWLQEDDWLQQQDQEEIFGQFEQIEPEYTGTGMRLFNNFLDLGEF